MDIWCALLESGISTKCEPKVFPKWSKDLLTSKVYNLLFFFQKRSLFAKKASKLQGAFILEQMFKDLINTYI